MVCRVWRNAQMPNAKKARKGVSKWQSRPPALRAFKAPWLLDYWIGARRQSEITEGVWRAGWVDSLSVSHSLFGHLFKLWPPIQNLGCISTPRVRGLLSCCFENRTLPGKYLSPLSQLEGLRRSEPRFYSVPFGGEMPGTFDLWKVFCSTLYRNGQRRSCSSSVRSVQGLSPHEHPSHPVRSPSKRTWGANFRQRVYGGCHGLYTREGEKRQKREKGEEECIASSGHYPLTNARTFASPWRHFRRVTRARVRHPPHLGYRDMQAATR